MPRLACPAAVPGHLRAASVGLSAACLSWTVASGRESDNGVVGARQLENRQAQRWVRRFAATVGGSWLLSRLMPTLDRASLRVTGHRYTLPPSWPVYPWCS